MFSMLNCYFLKMYILYTHKIDARIRSLEFTQRCIKCLALYCQFTNKVEAVIIHSIKCPFHLIYCGCCNTLSNVAVLTHD